MCCWSGVFICKLKDSLVSDYFKILHRLEVKGIQSRELMCLFLRCLGPNTDFSFIWIQKDIWGHPRLDVFKTSLAFHWLLLFHLSFISKAMNSMLENNTPTGQKSFLLDNYCMGNYLSAGIKLFNPNWCNKHLLIFQPERQHPVVIKVLVKNECNTGRI